MIQPRIAGVVGYQGMVSAVVEMLVALLMSVGGAGNAERSRQVVCGSCPAVCVDAVHPLTQRTCRNRRNTLVSLPEFLAIGVLLPLSCGTMRLHDS